MDRPADRRLAGQALRADVLRWMDQWVDLVLAFLAVSAIPLLVVEVGQPEPGDARLVVAGSWIIWGAFTANTAVRLALTRDRAREARWLAPIFLLIVGQPLLSIGERKATPVLALIPLVAAVARGLLKGRVLRRTGHTIRSSPLRVIAFVVPTVWVLGAALVYRFERETGTVTSFGDGLWWGAVTLATVGYGDISPKSSAGRTVAVAIMVVGIGMFSVVTAQLAERLVARRRALGRSPVQEADHTLVLGWSPMVFTIVEQLVEANRSRARPSIVILADRETEDMYGELRAHVVGVERANTTIVCRQGDPSDPADLRRCQPHLARSIIVVSGHDDAAAARSLLALVHLDPPLPVIPVVAQVDDAATASALEHALRDRVMIVNPSAFLARTAARACLDAGSGLAYEELLDVQGSEIYVQAVPGTAGRTFGDVVLALADACVVGLELPDGRLDLCPPFATVVAEGQALVVVASDDSVLDHPDLGGAADAAQGARALGPVVAPTHRDDRDPVQVLVLGWNAFGPLVLDELDAFVGPGSRITVAVDAETAASVPGERPELSSAELAWHEVPPAGYAALVERLLRDVPDDGRPADHVMVLCARGGVSPSVADTRALLTTLQVRGALHGRGHETTVVTELLDQRDVALAPPSALGDFIVSDRLVSLLLSRLSEDAHLETVFADLIDPLGAEIYGKPAAWYGVPPEGVEVPFAGLVAAGAARGECVIGYRRRGNVEEGRFGLVIDPPRSATVVLAAGDQVVVVADEAG